MSAPPHEPAPAPALAGTPRVTPAESLHGHQVPRRRPVTAAEVLFFLPRLLQRLLLWRLLDRYVMGELLGPLLFGWTLFIVLFVFSLNLYKLAQLVAAGAPPAYVAEMLWLRVILSSVYCLPMAMLLAGLMAFGRLSGDSELVAMQASGIRNLRVVWNAILLGLVVSVAGLAINEYVIPPAGKRLRYVEDIVKALLRGKLIDAATDQRAFIIQEYENRHLARLVVAQKFEEENPPEPAVLRDVTYMSYDSRGEVNYIVQARRAEWIKAEEGKPGTQQWVFYQATSQMLGPSAGGRPMLMTSERMPMTLHKTPRQVRREMKQAEDMSYRELRQYIRQLKRDRRLQRSNVSRRALRELEVELERKLAVPFAAVVLATIGAPLGIRRQRSTAGVGIGLSLLIIITYYIGMSFLGVLGQNGTLRPAEAAWGCNVAGLLVGLVLTWRRS